MEEDIKILEDFLVGNKQCNGCEEKCVDCYIEYEEVQAVANLIKGYRELEDRYLKNRQRTIKLESKIKEKIEWSKDTITHLDNDGTDLDMKMLYEYAIEVLQELMEDK